MLHERDLAGLAPLFQADGRPDDQLADYHRQHLSGDRLVLVGRVGGAVAGYVTWLRRSAYLPFANAGIPEINDLMVGKAHRRRGLGRALVAAAEALTCERHYTDCGIGVWEHSDGAARRLYEQLGYAWDGRDCLATPWGHIRYLIKKLVASGVIARHGGAVAAG